MQATCKYILQVDRTIGSSIPVDLASLLPWWAWWAPGDTRMIVHATEPLSYRGVGALLTPRHTLDELAVSSRCKGQFGVRLFFFFFSCFEGTQSLFFVERGDRRAVWW